MSCSRRSVSPLSWIAALKRNMEKRGWHSDDRNRNCETLFCGRVSNILNTRKVWEGKVHGEKVRGLRVTGRNATKEKMSNRSYWG